MSAMVERYARSYGAGLDSAAIATPPAMPVSCQPSVASQPDAIPFSP